MSPTRKIARDFSENQSAMCHRHCTSRTYVLAQKSAVKPPMALQSQETLSVPLCLALVTYRTFALTMTNNGGSLTQIMNNNSCYIFGQKIRRELSNSRIFPFGFLFFLPSFFSFLFFFFCLIRRRKCHLGFICRFYFGLTEVFIPTAGGFQ